MEKKTPQQTAKEIRDKFQDIDDTPWSSIEYVKGIIEAHEEYRGSVPDMVIDSRINFYNEVIEELENM